MPLVIDAPPAQEWPFRHPLCPPLPAERVMLRARNALEACESAQREGDRLVTTQRAYLDAEWAAALARHGDAVMVVEEGEATPVTHPLAAAYRIQDAVGRLTACLEVLKSGRTAAALVATASVCMEVNDFESAARDLDDAIALAPDWAAAHYERGKLCLRTDDLLAASAAFARATDFLPGFEAAWSNLGAALGEQERSAEALAAFERALALNPESPQALNNVGVARRELGRLAESEAAFRKVIHLTPGMAFGHYNLGHTLFLQGRFQAALAAYAEGRARDPEKNPVQASRLALCKVATGDAHGALRELQQSTTALPRDYRRQLLAETSAILWALVTQHPDLQQWQPVHEWLTKELNG